MFGREVVEGTVKETTRGRRVILELTEGRVPRTAANVRDSAGEAQSGGTCDRKPWKRLARRRDRPERPGEIRDDDEGQRK